MSGVARADSTTVDGGPAPIVRIMLPVQATLTIRTWDRESVQVEGEPGALAIERRTARFGSSAAPVLIGTVKVRRGDNTIVLPAETFVVSGVAAGDHDVVKITPSVKRPLGSVTVTVPADSAVVTATVDRGSILLRDYRNGTFILHLHNGQAVMQNVGGDGFVQVLQGSVQAFDSSFDRLRVRTAVGNQIYQRCKSRQIEAWSAEGSVVYDAGTFEPGLARFESTDGNVAVGVSAGTQLVARAGGGKVYTLFDRITQVDGRAGEANASYAGGGPMVNIVSTTGLVYLYDGGLSLKRKLPAEWRPAMSALRNEPMPAPAPRRERVDAPPSPPPADAHPRRRPGHPSSIGAE